MAQSKPSPFPAEGTQQYRLLTALLDGRMIDPITAITDLNVGIVAARAAELRRLGWSVRTMEIPHPNKADFPDATLTRYFMDQHYRAWMKDSPAGTHPDEYPFDDGRGRFTADFMEKERKQ